MPSVIYFRIAREFLLSFYTNIFHFRSQSYGLRQKIRGHPKDVLLFLVGEAGLEFALMSEICRILLKYANIDRI